MQDPLHERISQLLVAKRRGALSDAQAEELALYVEDDQKLVSTIEAQLARDPEAGTWIARTEQDQALELQSRDQARRWRRAAILTIGSGLVLSVLSPVLGLGFISVGVVGLVATLIRQLVQQHRDDPYRKVSK
jgi:anti-sigma factor RsiW